MSISFLTTVILGTAFLAVSFYALIHQQNVTVERKRYIKNMGSYLGNRVKLIYPILIAPLFIIVFLSIDLEYKKIIPVMAVVVLLTMLKLIRQYNGK